MKNVLLFILTNLFSILGHTQICTYQDLFPIKAGTTKFVASNFINSNNQYKKNYERTDIIQPDYLKNKNISVKKTLIVVDISNSTCLKGSNVKLQLTFADDKLYMISITAEYTTNSYPSMKEDYNNIMIAIENSEQYKYAKGIISRNQDNIQIGEGYRYTKLQKQGTQFEESSVKYTLESVNKRDRNFELITEEIYKIEVNYTNLFVTKLDSREY